jgi:hypothetical protein
VRVGQGLIPLAYRMSWLSVQAAIPTKLANRMVTLPNEMNPIRISKIRQPIEPHRPEVAALARCAAVSACQSQSIRSSVPSRGVALLIATDCVALSSQLLVLSLAIRPTDFRFPVADSLTCEHGAAGNFGLVNIPPPYRIPS